MGSVLGFPTADPVDLIVGARVRRWRDRRGMEREELAAMLHLSAADIRMIEAGRRHLNSAELDAATRALRLPIWALVADTPAH
ncbi:MULTISPECIES: helix-turn-helix domain-containing protein [unclassified Brevundimonas]|uniref:helix-turn-helix domain-containing protein n=1 Tax=unclassified Brevundimonas TaxID=2622653 RepID=UPI0025BC391D|nr:MULTISPECIES: helix-turn-helix transcriptional regulator [unclassified Brevundimonas]